MLPSAGEREKNAASPAATVKAESISGSRSLETPQSSGKRSEKKKTGAAASARSSQRGQSERHRQPQQQRQKRPTRTCFAREEKGGEQGCGWVGMGKTGYGGEGGLEVMWKIGKEKKERHKEEK